MKFLNRLLAPWRTPASAPDRFPIEALAKFVVVLADVRAVLMAHHGMLNYQALVLGKTGEALTEIAKAIMAGIAELEKMVCIQQGDANHG